MQSSIFSNLLVSFLIQLDLVLIKSEFQQEKEPRDIIKKGMYYLVLFAFFKILI